MPYIKTTLTNQYLLEDFWSVLRSFTDENGDYWWGDFNSDVDSVDLYRVTFQEGVILSPDGDTWVESDTTKVKGKMCVTKHKIMRRYDNEYLGMALSTGTFNVEVEEAVAVAKGDDGVVDAKRLIPWAVGKFDDLVDYNTIYMYTLDSYYYYTHRNLDGGGTAPIRVISGGNGDLVRSSLDIEFFDDDEFYPETMQSTIVPIHLVDKGLSLIYNISGNRYRETNWWGSSKVRLEGYIEENDFLFTLLADTAPNWGGNAVPKVPLFFGNLVGYDEDKRVALFGGTQVSTFFDFDKVVDNNQRVLLPITKAYPSHPASGTDRVVLKEGKNGSRYQSHYIRWNAPPNLIPPPRVGVPLEGDDSSRKYPRSYDKPDNNFYKYNFNVSRYSDKVESSRCYIVHPEEGVVGHLPNTLISPSMGMRDNDILEVDYHCRDCNGDGVSETVTVNHTVHIIEGMSVFTKIPATPFRVAAIGIADQPVPCPETVTTPPPSPSVDNPTSDDEVSEPSDPPVVEPSEPPKTEPNEPSPDPVDENSAANVVIYIDASYSMDDTILEGIENQVKETANYLETEFSKQDKECKVSIVFFGDSVEEQFYKTALNQGTPSDVPSAFNDFSNISGGGDTPESGLLAFNETMPLFYGVDELNVVSFYTDAPFKEEGDATYDWFSSYTTDNPMELFGVIFKGEEQEVKDIFDSHVYLREMSYDGGGDLLEFVKGVMS